jgi:hypothetical protein
MSTSGAAHSASNLLEPRTLRPSFSGHGTFAFRYGWLKKAVDAVAADSGFFVRDHALVGLGVGKNMVQSIRYWGLATRMLEESAGRELRVSAIGSALLGRWDSYLEDAASLWLLHWFLVTNPAWAGVWHVAFTGLMQPDFTKSELAASAERLAQHYGVRANTATIERDVDCFVRTYLPARGVKTLLEDSFDCPLTELGLLQPLHEGDRYRFVIGEKPGLPAAVFGYALLEFLRSHRQERRTFSLQECLYGTGSPGQVFKLNENSLIEYLEQLESSTSGALALDETEGLKQVYVRGDIDAVRLLEQFYERGTA